MKVHLSPTEQDETVEVIIDGEWVIEEHNPTIQSKIMLRRADHG